MKKQFVFILILLFLFLSVFGMNMSMSMDKTGKMTNCPFMNGSSSLCKMGVTDHMSKWLQMFQAVSVSSIFSLFVLGLFFIAWSFSQRTYFSLAPPKTISLKLYQKEHSDSNLFNNLLVAFSDGILHPKIYA